MLLRLLFLFAVSLGTAYAQNSSDVSDSSTNLQNILSDENLLITEVYIDRLNTNEAVEVFQYESGYLVPLILLSQTVDFPITFDEETKIATGWFIEEKNTFTLDLNSKTISIKGSKKSTGERLVTEYFGDIYVDATFLSDWFAIDVDLDFSQLILRLKPRTKLPIQLKIQREVNRQRLKAFLPQKNNYPTYTEPYRLLSFPTTDIDISQDYEKEGSPQNSFDYALFSTGDVGYLNSQLSLSGNSTSDEISSVRWTLGRKDHKARLLGALRASEFDIGDVNSAPLPLIAGRSQGRGAFISNFRLERPDSFNTTNFIGNSLPGWEVELYRNGVLLSFLTVGNDGRYEFEDVPIFYGNNNFRIVSYGPQGQVKEEVRNFLIDDSILKKGEFNYRVSVDDKSKTIFGVNENLSPPNHDQGIRGIANIEYGVNNKITASLGAARTILEDNRFHNYQLIGARGSFAGIFADSNFAYDSTDQSWAARIQADSRINNINVRFEQSFFDENFVSEIESVNSSRRRSFTDFDINGRINKILPSGLTYEFGAENTVLHNGDETISLNNRMSSFLWSTNISNNLIYSRIDQDSEIDDIVTGNFSLRRRFKKYIARFTSDYELAPQKELESINLSLQRNLGLRSNVRLGLNKEFVGNRTISFNASYNKQFENFRLSVVTDADDEDNFSIGSRLSFAFGYEPRDKKIFFSGNDIASEGAISAQAYVDNNYNSRFDKSETKKDDIGFVIGGRKLHPHETQAMLISGVNSHTPNEVSLDLTTIADPFYTPAQKGFNVITRPGVVTKLDYPILITTEIDGSIYYKKGDAIRRAASVELQLVDKDGKIVRSTNSEFDGFYIFMEVVPGKYKLRISSEHLQSINAKNNPSIDIEIKPHDDFITGQDLTILL